MVLSTMSSVFKFLMKYFLRFSRKYEIRCVFYAWTPSAFRRAPFISGAQEPCSLRPLYRLAGLRISFLAFRLKSYPLPSVFFAVWPLSFSAPPPRMVLSSLPKPLALPYTPLFSCPFSLRAGRPALSPRPGRETQRLPRAFPDSLTPVGVCHLLLPHCPLALGSQLD